MNGRVIRDVKEYKDEEILSLLDEDVKEWVVTKLKSFTPPQKYSVVSISKKENILISSPTGSGKTFAAFLAIINHLVLLAKNGMLEDKIYAIYISPLKALGNDVEKNLNLPLREISQYIKEKGGKMQEIRIGKRTGDVSSYERSKQLKNPPHILITTPETFAISLSSPRFSLLMRNADYVIVDEVHALAENKRGTHLSLSLERLAYYKEFVRIGLSATVAPLDEIALFLLGEKEGRRIKVVDVNYSKKMSLFVRSPVKDLIYAKGEEMNKEFYRLLDELISSHRTTLIFTNTRAGTERIVHYLKSKYEGKYEEIVEAHHGSLSKDVRLEVERKLKEGKLKCVVTSTSLELGIDIGYVDLVILVGSPKSVSRALQRVGRAGHKLHEISKGVFVALNRDDLVEVTVMAKHALERHIDRVHIPTNALDVLAQHIVGMSLERKWKVKEAYELIRKAYPYKSLKLEEFIDVLDYLSGNWIDLERKSVYGKIWYDPSTQEFGRRGRNIRMIYATNTGTIPDESMVKVKTQEGKYIGKVEEEFAERLRKGDRFVLAGRVYEFISSRLSSIKVKEVRDATPTVPSWFSEQLPLSFDLAMKINDFRREMDKLLDSWDEQNISKYLLKNYPVSMDAASNIVEYFKEQKDYLMIPSNYEILVEHYIDEIGRNNYIFHTLFGRKVNDALSRALAHIVTEMWRTNVGVVVNDNGFMLSLPSNKKIDIRKATTFLVHANVENILIRALENTEMFKRRFRQVAVRGFLILRSYKGKNKSVGRQLFNSQTIYKIIKKEAPDFPLIKETYREIMEDVMDIKNAKFVLENIRSNKWKFVFIDNLEIPSPFAHNLLLLGDSDIVMMESKREMLKILHRQIMRRIEEMRKNE